MVARNRNPCKLNKINKSMKISLYGYMQVKEKKSSVNKFYVDVRRIAPI